MEDEHDEHHLNEDVEYFVSLSGATRALKWPAGAPALPHTVIVV